MIRRKPQGLHLTFIMVEGRPGPKQALPRTKGTQLLTQVTPRTRADLPESTAADLPESTAGGSDTLSLGGAAAETAPAGLSGWRESRKSHVSADSWQQRPPGRPERPCPERWEVCLPCS